MDGDWSSVQCHSYNHGAQKSVLQSDAGRSHVADLGTQLGPNERGFLIFLIGPNDKTRDKWEKEELGEPTSEIADLLVGVQKMVNPTFVEMQSCVKDAIMDACHEDDREEMEKATEDHYDWGALAASWLECSNDDIMALCLGPFLDVGFSVFCYERSEH